MPSITIRARRLRALAGGVPDRVLDLIERAPEFSRRARQWGGLLTTLGRTVAVLGGVAWVAGAWLGWRELIVVAGGSLALLGLAALFVVRPPALATEVTLEPSRVKAGDPSVAQIRATNGYSRRTLPAQVELPVGESVAVFDIPALGPETFHEEEFIVPTERRGVIPIGPATSVRGDPLGLFHREARSGKAQELIVHPRTVPLDPFGSGLLRDLEGLTTKDLSMSDLSFHALRDYSPGDDRRYVHWRSTAKAGRLLVRQFQDTRRSTLCVVVDGHQDGYGHPQEFETALEVAGSLVLRACRDELPAALVAADQAATGSTPHLLLDALARAQVHSAGAELAGLVSRAAARGADISFGLLVCGSARSPEQLQRAAARFAPEVRVLAIRVVPDEPAGVRAGGRASILQLQKLADLSGLMRVEVGA